LLIIEQKTNLAALKGISNLNKGFAMNKVMMLVLTLFVTGIVMSGCTMQKGSSGHDASTTRNNKHFWKYHGK